MVEDPPQKRPDPPKHELEFIGLLLNFPHHSRHRRPTPPDSPSDARTQALCHLLFERHAQQAIDYGMIINELQDNVLSRLFAACAALGFDEDQAEQMWHGLNRFQRDSLSRAKLRSCRL